MKSKIKQLDGINNLLIAVLTLDFFSNDAKADILLTMRINKDISNCKKRKIYMKAAKKG